MAHCVFAHAWKASCECAKYKTKYTYLKRLVVGERVHHNEAMAVFYIQIPHGGELFGAGSVQNLQHAWRVVHLWNIRTTNRVRIKRSQRKRRYMSQRIVFICDGEVMHPRTRVSLSPSLNYQPCDLSLHVSARWLAGWLAGGNNNT